MEPGQLRNDAKDAVPPRGGAAAAGRVTVRTLYGVSKLAHLTGCFAQI